MIVNVSYINWDTDNEAVDLPQRLIIPIPDHIEDEIEIEDFVSETISEDTGFSHKGFGYEIIGN